MDSLEDYIENVIKSNYEAHRGPTILFGILTFIGFVHFTLNFLSYFNMIGDLFFRRPTDVSIPTNQPTKQTISMLLL